MEREVDDDDDDDGGGDDDDDNIDEGGIPWGLRRGVAVNAEVFDARRRTPLAAAAGAKFFIALRLVSLVMCQT
jgi:hypothetical protein